MKKVILASAFAASLVLASSSAVADPVKIGVIDLQQIMQKSSQIAAINNQLTKDFKPRQEKIVTAQKDLQTETDQLTRNSATMTETDRNKLQDKLIADRSNVQAQMLTFQRDLNAAQNQAMQKFMTQLNDVVSKVAANGGFDLVLQKAGVPFVKTSLDVTNQVLEQLNKKS